MSATDAAAREFAACAADLAAAETDGDTFNALRRWLIAATALTEMKFGKPASVPGRALLNFLAVTARRAEHMRAERREH